MIEISIVRYSECFFRTIIILSIHVFSQIRLNINTSRNHSLFSQMIFLKYFYYFLLPTVQPSNTLYYPRNTNLIISILNYWYEIKLMLDYVLHIQHKAFKWHFVGRVIILLCWSVENCKSNTSNNVQPNNSNVVYIYTILIRYILLYYRHLHFKKYFIVGLLDRWTLCFENYLFKISISLFGISLNSGGSGD